MIRIAICDDEEYYRETIRNVILDRENKENVVFYEFESGEEFLQQLWQKYDLVFMDIKMPGIDGNKTAQAFRKINEEAVLIFCTNYSSPTTDSFKVQPYRYIIKDIRNKYLYENIGDILKEVRRKQKNIFLDVLEDGKLTRLVIDEIVYISVAKRGVIIHCYEKPDRFCRRHIKEIYEELKGVGFEHAHNSYIVNLTNIIKLEKNVIVMKNGVALNISRSKKEQFHEAFTNYLQLRYMRR